MRLVRFEEAGAPQLGVMNGDEVVPLAGLASTYPTMLSIVQGGEAALSEVRRAAASASKSIPIKQVKLLAPIERPGKFLAIGMNYRKHAEEFGSAPPSKQYWFNKQTTCIAGPFDDTDPGVSEALDYEVELGVVIGKAAKGVSVEAARKHVFADVHNGKIF
jgi:2-keto-4-pentenoate hydratase/2-oxohepta-3-ene-1,7-dioic acid hydratase in catechol pathway